MPQQVSAGFLRSWFTYDPDTGAFRWNHSPNRRIKAGDLAGSIVNGRAFVCVLGVKIPAGRAAWMLANGTEPSGVIDHINGNPLDNRIANLRDVTQQVNTQNQRRSHRRSSTGLLGVIPRPKQGKYDATICINGKSVYLGRFDTAQQAHDCYLQAKRAMHAGSTI